MSLNASKWARSPSKWGVEASPANPAPLSFNIYFELMANKVNWSRIDHKFLHKSIYFWLAFESCFHGHA